MHKRRLIKRVWLATCLILVLMNVVAVVHAWKFTHFSLSEIPKISSPEALSLAGKLKALAFGVQNPKPRSAQKPETPYEVLNLQSNVQLETFHMPVTESKGVVLIFHGYGSEKSSRLAQAAYFNSLGYAAILTDFMGSGNSEGSQTTIGYLEAENVHTVFNYAKTRYKRVILYGNSMGAAAVLRSISRLGLRPAAVVAECPFGSMQQAVENRFANMGVPAFSMAYLLTFWGGVVNGFNAYSHNPAAYARDVQIPVLLMYGAQDVNVSRAETDAVFRSLGSSCKVLKIFPAAGHEDYLKQDAESWKQAVAAFLEGCK
jgi:alpha-beta hydrolase superfamily lysophospholipase